MKRLLTGTLKVLGFSEHFVSTCDVTAHRLLPDIVLRFFLLGAEGRVALKEARKGES